MAFKKVVDLNPDRTISLGGFNKKTKKDNPTEAEGYYLGNKTIPDTKKPNGLTYIYAFQTKSGVLGVWGKTDLDRKMQGVPLGTMVRIKQNGMQATKNGEMYKFEVAYDPDNTIEVDTPSGYAVAGGVVAGDSAENGDEEDADFAEIESSFEEEEAYSPPSRVVASASNKEKVAALLSGKGKNK